MKTLSLVALAATAAAAAAALWTPRWLETRAASTAACCEIPAVSAAALPGLDRAAPAASLPARSLYHLDSVWTDDTGATRTLASLRGGPVVLAMIFTHCEYACPTIVADLQQVRAALPEAERARTRFVLVSFDTARDTPAVLRAYRARMHLDDPAWTLLHGGTSEVQELAMLLGVKFKPEARGAFSHSNTITVLSEDGEIAFQREGLRGDVGTVARAVAGKPL